MDNKISEFNEKRKNILSVVVAVLLHTFSMYLVVYLQNVACPRCSGLMYMIIKFVLRWFYLLVPVCFMKIEHVTLKDIGITKNKLPKQVIIGILIGALSGISYSAYNIITKISLKKGSNPISTTFYTFFHRLN